jgi:transcriptional regulator with XRE-family HTH domain
VSTFENWRKSCGLSVREAADLLGMTRQMGYLLENGREPRVDTRKLMSVIAQGQRPEPWPVTSCE